MSHPTRRAFAAGLAAAAATSPGAAGAQGEPGYPSKPIKLIAPFPPGGAADLIARLLAQKIGEGLRQPMIVDNRPGAGTTIATDVVAKAAPDGYTLLEVVRDMALNPSIYSQLPFDTLKAFAWIGMVAESPYVLVANPSLPVNSIAELAALAKAKPGSISYGSLGIGGLGHINIEALKQHLGIDMLHVPYKGAGPALNAAVSGEIGITIAALAGAIPLIREGRLKGLAVGAPKRSAQLPEVPTTGEAGGGTDTLLPAYFGLAAPAGTPRPIIDRLAGELRRVLTLPDVLEKIAQSGLEPSYASPEAFAETMATDVVRFGKLVKAIGLTPQ